jgi:hypothetical protein
MDYNELFESVLSESEETVDFLSEPLEPISFVGSPLIYENVLFERVLREAQNYQFFAIFQATDKGFALMPNTVSNNFMDVFYEWQKTKYNGAFVIWPSKQNGELFSEDKNQLAIAASYINNAVKSAYKIARNPNKQRLEISKKIFGNYTNMTDEEYNNRVEQNFLNPPRR